jgi:ABC-2 type transport system permease protein
MKIIMNTAGVVLKTFIRNRKTLIVRLIFPVVLILVLSMAFSRSFDNQSISLSGDTVAYKAGSGAAAAVLQQFIKYGEDKLDLMFVEVKDQDQALQGVRNNKYEAYIAVQDGKLAYYENSNLSYNFDAEVIEPALQGLAMRSGAAVAISSVSPGSAMAKDIGSYTRSVSVNLKPQSAMDYYAVAIFLMISLYGASIGSNAVNSDRVFRTGFRVSASPVSPYQIFIGRILGSVAAGYLAAVILIVVSTMFGANWGGNIPLTLLIALTFVIFAQAFGIAMGVFVKNRATINVILNFGVQIVAFLGGCYFPAREFTGLLLKLSNLSPIKWTAMGIFDSILNVSGNSALAAIAINLGATALLFMAAVFKLNRERVLN